jgi:hypothetical protein
VVAGASLCAGSDSGKPAAFNLRGKHLRNYHNGKRIRTLAFNNQDTEGTSRAARSGPPALNSPAPLNQVEAKIKEPRPDEGTEALCTQTRCGTTMTVLC